MTRKAVCLLSTVCMRASARLGQRLRQLNLRKRSPRMPGHLHSRLSQSRPDRWAHRTGTVASGEESEATSVVVKEVVSGVGSAVTSVVVREVASVVVRGVTSAAVRGVISVVAKGALFGAVRGVASGGRGRSHQVGEEGNWRGGPDNEHRGPWPWSRTRSIRS
ncbi:hypothetical protein DFH11DRAFT_431078 [Phellopilus nigrolimitatus]|nr:hypothetical protein DFH11DRAFT_431078 [Phellopilus nigrolimitatus]